MTGMCSILLYKNICYVIYLLLSSSTPNHLLSLPNTLSTIMLTPLSPISLTNLSINGLLAILRTSNVLPTIIPSGILSSINHQIEATPLLIYKYSPIAAENTKEANINMKDNCHPYLALSEDMNAPIAPPNILKKICGEKLRVKVVKNPSIFYPSDICVSILYFFIKP